MNHLGILALSIARTLPIAQFWNLDESTVYQIGRKGETLLMQSGKFNLAGNKQLQQLEHEIQVIGVDVSETPVERPKKTATLLQCGKSGENNSCC